MTSLNQQTTYSDHFAGAGKMVGLGSESERQVEGHL